MLNSLIEFDVVLRNKSDGFSGFARTSRSSDTMDVRLGIRRDVVVNDDIDVRYVDTTWSNVRCDLEKFSQ